MCRCQYGIVSADKICLALLTEFLNLSLHRKNTERNNFRKRHYVLQERNDLLTFSKFVTHSLVNYFNALLTVNTFMKKWFLIEGSFNKN
jgi:hypothetical protein